MNVTPNKKTRGRPTPDVPEGLHNRGKECVKQGGPSEPSFGVHEEACVSAESPSTDSATLETTRSIPVRMRKQEWGERNGLPADRARRNSTATWQPALPKISSQSTRPTPPPALRGDPDIENESRSRRVDGISALAVDEAEVSQLTRRGRSQPHTHNILSADLAFCMESQTSYDLRGRVSLET